MKTVLIFGNPDLPEDSLPLKILPELRKLHPEISFKITDPNEEWDIPALSSTNVPEEITVIDTAIEINEITIFDTLEKFSPAPRVSLHDFDALANLRLLQKLGKIKKIKIIGIPPDYSNETALKELAEIL